MDFKTEILFLHTLTRVAIAEVSAILFPLALVIEQLFSNYLVDVTHVEEKS